MEKVALVTGSSSGIGLETALALARDGFHTFASMRDIGKAVELEHSAKKRKSSNRCNRIRCRQRRINSFCNQESSYRLWKIRCFSKQRRIRTIWMYRRCIS